MFGFGLGLWEGDVGARAGYLVLVYPIQGSLSTFILKRCRRSLPFLRFFLLLLGHHNHPHSLLLPNRLSLQNSLGKVIVISHKLSHPLGFSSLVLLLLLPSLNNLLARPMKRIPFIKLTLPQYGLFILAILFIHRYNVLTILRDNVPEALLLLLLCNTHRSNTHTAIRL